MLHIQGEKVTKKCNYIPFRDHPQKGRRKACGQELLMTLYGNDGKKLLYPFKTYCYMPLGKAVEKLLLRKEVDYGCEHWKSRETKEGIMTDIYDGVIWKDNIEDLNVKNTYGLAINLDWFYPFEHVRSYSVGVIYGVLLNLPRSERYLRKKTFFLLELYQI